MVAVTVKDLVKTYGKRQRITYAVDSVNLEVAEGELLVLLGPSGCGKSTILRCIAGLLDPDSGGIAIGGAVVYSRESRLNIAAHKRNVGMVFQSFALWPHKTVFQNVRFPLVARRFPRGEMRDRVMAVLEVVQCAHLAERYPAQLSGGQQQRIALARALVGEPAVLLLDEPLSNLDAVLREEMRAYLKELHDEIGFTGIYVTHDQSEAMALADRVAVMSAGQFLQKDTPHTVYYHPADVRVADFLGVRNSIPVNLAEGVIETPWGVRLPVDRWKSVGAKGGSGTLCIRAGDLNISNGTVPPSERMGSDPDLHLGIGEISSAQWMGATQSFAIKMPTGAKLDAIVSDAPTDISIGVKVSVTCPPDRALLYVDGGLIS